MQPQDREQFFADMRTFRGCYPGQRLEDGAIVSYWRTLEHLPWAAVKAAITKAPQRFADRLPTAGQLLELARAEAKTGAPWKHTGWEAKPKAERELPPDSPWAKFAEYLEQENRHYEKHPEARPEDLNERRFKYFARLWEKTFGERWDNAGRREAGEDYGSDQQLHGEEPGAGSGAEASGQAPEVGA